ncbi:MAG: bifunctional glutamate N-acetyltransferase/amino-acid acetyltransferase ArgJ [Candidatus Margulisbacteria bacterium]|nr:bifunctional glutamate N-acetyltransferase/amino-acid acetyltransferase ArgJ [Candidatus Margulisiibacteriota bacterium]
MKELKPGKSGRGGVTAPGDFLAAGIYSGVKRSGKKDLCLVFSKHPAAAAAVFTNNLVKAAPILLSQKQVRNGRIQAIVCNSGNANCCTGKQGMTDAYAMIDETALALGIKKGDVLIASTGVIGELMPMEKILPGIKKAAGLVSQNGGRAAAEAILTTDTRAKQIAVALDGYTIGGVAKGSGMIAPSMATMHAFITTDAVVDKKTLQDALRDAVSETFNMISVDLCMSTNDCVFALANGASKVKISSGKASKRFTLALTHVCKHLAKEIARDGEGATKLVEVKVTGAASKQDAKRAALSIVSSDLFKAAVFGSDPNWGRIMGALGAVPIKLNPDKVDIFLNNIMIAQNGAKASFSRSKMARQMAKKELHYRVELKLGNESAEAWGCDLTYDYVKINARYHT